MKKLSIIRFILSRSLLSEFILFLQLTCLAVFAIGTIQPIERYIRQIWKLERLYSFDQSRTFYINPGEFIANAQALHLDVGQSEWKEKLLAEESVQDVGASCIAYASCTLSSGMMKIPVTLNVIINSENQKNYIRPGLSEGKTGVVVSHSMRDRYPVGSTIEINFWDSEATQTFTVTGILGKDAAIAVIAPHGTDAQMDAFAAFTEDFPDSWFVVIHDDTLIEAMAPERNYWVVGRDGTQATSEAISRAVSNLGTVRTMQDAFSEVVGLIIQRNSRFIYAFFLFVLVAIFGFGGYELLLHRRRQGVLGVLFLNGATKKRIVWSLFSIHFLLVLLSSFIGWLIEPAIFQIILIQEQVRSGTLGIWITVLFLASVLAISQIYSYIKIQKLSVAELCHRGDN